MRRRFWATMRRPAFSMTALTAPVRFRFVASGLMIEKVRSRAMAVPGLAGIAGLLCGGGPPGAMGVAGRAGYRGFRAPPPPPLTRPWAVGKAAPPGELSD